MRDDDVKRKEGNEKVTYSGARTMIFFATWPFRVNAKESLLTVLWN